MKRFLFDFITSGFSLFENPFYNFIAMAIVGSIAFSIAWNIVDVLGFRKSLGSAVHWIVRLIAFAVIWFIFLLIINIFRFIIKNWIIISISVVALITLFIIMKYAKNHPNSFWNKKINFKIFSKPCK